MNGNEMNTRPRVCLTKPNRSTGVNVERELPSFMPEHIADEVIPSTQHQREITPVHLCAEYSPEPPTSDFANILYDAVRNGYSQYFFPMHPILAPTNHEIRNNRIVIPDIHNPLCEKKYIQSLPLNAIQDLGEYMASSEATVNGIISLLIAKEKDFCKRSMYSEWCYLLKDIKDNDTSKIEAVLNGERKYCYDALGYCATGYVILPKQVHCYLFAALKNVLERETEVMVNPLFLFLCENLLCFPTITDRQTLVMSPFAEDASTRIAYHTDELFAMYSLTAYGALNETKLTLSPPNNALSRFVYHNRKEGHFVNSVLWGFGIMLLGSIATMAGWALFGSSIITDVMCLSSLAGGVAVGGGHALMTWICEKLYRKGELNRAYQHKQLGYLYFKSKFIPTTAHSVKCISINGLESEGSVL